MKLLDVNLVRERLERIFPRGIGEHALLVRDVAAYTIQAALFLGAVGDPDDPETPLLRPSMVCWLNDAALAQEDEAFRGEWHRRAAKGRNQLVKWLEDQGLTTAARYRDNSRETIRDEVLRPLLETHGAVRKRSGVATSSSLPTMALAEDFAQLFDPDLDGDDLEAAILAWQEAHLGPAARAQLRAGRLLAAPGTVTVTLPRRGDRILAAGPSDSLTKAAVEQLAPRLMVDPYVLAICHGGDPTAEADRDELARVGLPLSDSPALPDVIVFDAVERTFWFIEIVVTEGAVHDQRRKDLLHWAERHRIAPHQCGFVTVYSGRSAPAFRKTVARIAWGTLVWFADEPGQVVRLEDLPERGTSGPAPD